MRTMKFINDAGKIKTAKIAVSKRAFGSYINPPNCRSNVVKAMAKQGYKPLNH